MPAFLTTTTCLLGGGLGSCFLLECLFCSFYCKLPATSWRFLDAWATDYHLGDTTWVHFTVVILGDGGNYLPLGMISAISTFYRSCLPPAPPPTCWISFVPLGACGSTTCSFPGLGRFCRSGTWVEECYCCLPLDFCSTCLRFCHLPGLVSIPFSTDFCHSTWVLDSLSRPFHSGRFTWVPLLGFTCLPPVPPDFLFWVVLLPAWRWVFSFGLPVRSLPPYRYLCRCLPFHRYQIPCSAVQIPAVLPPAGTCYRPACLPSCRPDLPAWEEAGSLGVPFYHLRCLDYLRFVHSTFLLGTWVLLPPAAPAGTCRHLRYLPDCHLPVLPCRYLHVAVPACSAQVGITTCLPFPATTSIYGDSFWATTILESMGLPPTIVLPTTWNANAILT